MLNRGASSRNFNIIVTIMAKGLKVNSLIGLAPLMLFLSSSIPLFGIVAFTTVFVEYGVFELG